MVLLCCSNTGATDGVWIPCCVPLLHYISVHFTSLCVAFCVTEHAVVITHTPKWTLFDMKSGQQVAAGSTATLRNVIE